MPRLTGAEIGKRLGIHKSTVSRQARSAGLMSADKLIDLDAYQDLRATGLDPALQTTGRAGPADEAEPSALAIERQRKMAADASRAELELKIREGEFIPRAKVMSTLGPVAKRLRDTLCAVARETVRDAEDRTGAEAAIQAAVARFAEELMGDAAGPT
jgi:hypothetical protein